MNKETKGRIDLMEILLLRESGGGKFTKRFQAHDREFVVARKLRKRKGQVLSLLAIAVVQSIISDDYLAP